MIKGVTLRGPVGSLSWGYRPVATVTRWTISRADERAPWVLSARIATHDPFQCRRGNDGSSGTLLFTAPRKGGLWCWPVVPKSLQVTAPLLLARLGAPEF